MREIIDRARVIESSVEQLYANWTDARRQQDVQNIIDIQQEQDRSTALSLYRIGQLEETSAGFANEIEQRRNDLPTQNILQIERSRRQLEADLKQQHLELQQRRKLIKQRSEIEVLNLKSQKAREHIADLRWAMNWRIAETNLSVQLSSIESQLTQYQRERDRNRSQARQTELKMQGLEHEEEIAKEQIAQANKRIDTLNTRKNEMFKARRVGLVAAGCQIETTLAFIGEPEALGNAERFANESECTIPEVDNTRIDLKAAICELRNDGALNKANDSAMTLACIIGDHDLPEFPEVTELREEGLLVEFDPDQCKELGLKQDDARLQSVRDVFKAEQGIATLKIQQLKQQKKLLGDQLKLVNSNKNASVNTQTAIQVQMTALGVAMSQSAGKPQMGTLKGSASGVIQLESIYSSAQAAYSIYRDFQSRQFSLDEYKRNFSEKWATLDQHLTQLKGEIKLEPYIKKIRERHLNAALLEIRGQALQMNHELRAQAMDVQNVRLDCDQQDNELQASIAQAVSRHRQLRADLKLAEDQNGVVDNDIAIEQSSIRQEQAKIQGYALQKEGLKQELDSIRSDNTSLETLISQAGNRLSALKSLRKELDGLEEEHTAEQAVLARIEQDRYDSVITGFEQQKEHVANVIRETNTQAGRLREVVAELSSAGLRDQKLNQELLDFQAGIQKDIAEERKSLLAISETRGEGEDKEILFLATQEQLAALMRGVPTYVENKRRLMERANRLLNLLFSRVDALSSLSGAGTGERGLTYVRTADALDDLENSISDRARWSRAPVLTEMARILIPRGSGLARALEKDQRARFEITPFADKIMGELGYFNLWSQNFSPGDWGMNQNLMLVDLFMGIDFSMSECSGRRYRLTHEGSGFVFNETSPGNPELLPRFIVTNHRDSAPTYIPISDVGETEWLRPLRQFWGRRHYLHNFLGEGRGPPNDVNANMPLLGVPLIGTYELVLPPAHEGCDYADAAYVLYTVFAKTIRATD